MNKELENYENACERLMIEFIESIVPDEEDRERILGDGFDKSSREGYWIGNEIGGAFNWWDYFVSIENMADYFRYGFTPDEFFEWYDQWGEGGGVNMKTFKALKKRKNQPVNY